MLVSAHADAGDADLVEAGEEAVPRTAVADTYPLDTGTMFATYFRARKTEPITSVRTWVDGTAAASITLARIGVYEAAADGALTLLTATANDTALWNATYSPFTKALADTFEKAAGARYAIGLLAVGTTMRVAVCQGVAPRAREPARRCSGTGCVSASRSSL